MGEARDRDPPAVRLRQLWHQGLRPNLDTFLGDTEPLNCQELADVLRVDQSERWLAGTPIPAEEYLQRYPSVASDFEAALDLIHNEYLLAERLEQDFDLEAFVGRFPVHAERLRVQIAFHLAVLPRTESALHIVKERQSDATDVTLPLNVAKATLPARERFGEYDLIEQVARGGMGVVYKARQPKLDRIVALKMILAGHLASPGAVERFRTEAQAAAHLDHPGIVPVFEIGELDGLHYFTMAFVEGRSLADRLRDGPLPAIEAVQLVRELCSAVAYAHEHGIVHRDLKPANVLIDAQGKSKLTDFGLAKRTYDSSNVTGTGEILGTPAYMSPEQASGGESGVGPLTDVYGLGALLFALLTGRAPFQAATPMETLQHVLSADPPRPKSLNPSIPRDLETICLKCLEKSPTKRYFSAGALAADLERFLEGRPIQARPVGVIGKAYRWYRRRPVIGSMAAGLLVLLVTIPILLASLWSEAEARARVEAAGRLQEEIARKKIEEAEVARTRELFEAYVKEAAARRASPRIGRRFQALERIVAARDLADELQLPAEVYTRLRSEAISALSLVDLRASTTGIGWRILGGPEFMRYLEAKDNYLEWSPPNGLIIRQAVDGRTVQEIRVERPEQQAGEAQLSPDNRFVSNLDGGLLRVWKVDGAQTKEVMRWDDIQEAGFAQDRPEIVILHQSRLISAEPLDDRGKVRRVNLPDFPMETIDSAIQIAPGPRRQVALAGMKCVRILNLDTGDVSVRFSVPERIEEIAWSADGETLAISCWSNGIVLCRPARKTQEMLKAPLGGPVHIAFDPSGRFLLLVSPWTSQNVLINVDSAAPELRFNITELGTLKGSPGQPSFPVCWAATLDGMHRTIPQLPTDGVAAGESLAVHPRGRLLATPTAKGVVFNDLHTGQRLGFIPSNGGFQCARFDADGSLYATDNDTRQVARWEVKRRNNRYSIDVMELIGRPGVASMDISPSGRYLATAVDDGALVLDRQTGTIAANERQHDVRQVAIHPNGSLVASFPWEPQGFQVWDAKSGKVLLDHPRGKYGRGRFSPDGKFLVTYGWGESDLLAWSMPECTLAHKLGPLGVFAISGDSRYVAVTEANGKIRLNRLADGQSIARFDAPGEDYLIDLAFSPDGRYLLGLNTERTRHHVWDLWKLREQLRELRLDWEETPPPEGDAIFNRILLTISR